MIDNQVDYKGGAGNKKSPEGLRGNYLLKMIFNFSKKVSFFTGFLELSFGKVLLFCSKLELMKVLRSWKLSN